MIIITRHAQERAKERLGLNKKAIERTAKKAYENGIRHGQTNGNLYKYISGICRKSMIKGSEIILYGDVVYCFKKDNDIVKLCTVYLIPHNLLPKTHGKQRKINGIKNKEDEK